MSGVVVEVSVEDGPPHCLRPGETFEFGRNEGPGQISTDRTVSGRHGHITATVSGLWELTNLSSSGPLLVLDAETPSRLHIAPTAGPVPVPFSHSTIVVQGGPGFQQHTLVVDAIGVERWSGSWASNRLRAAEARSLAKSAARLDEGTVAVALPDVFDPRTGRPYRWYLVLLALCEPLLQVPPEHDLPTSRGVMQILKTHGQTWLKSSDDIDKRFLPTIYRWVGLTPNSREQMRQEAVRRAIETRLVTREDLIHLDSTGDGADE